MRLLHQRRQLLLRPEIRVDGEIIRRGVLMVKVGGEDRGQVQALRAQLLQIRELLPNPRQIAAQIISPGRPGVPAVQGMPVRMQAASTETFRENLVVDQPACPFRRTGHVAGIDLQQLKKARLRFPVGKAVFAVISLAALPVLQEKEILQIMDLFQLGHFRQPFGGSLILCPEHERLRPAPFRLGTLPINHPAFGKIVPGGQQPEAHLVSCNRLPKQ